MERSTARVEDSADRRTELAADRTVFAAERTYAAWVRTGLVAMASGIGAKALLADFLPHWLVMTSGSVFILFSVFCFGAGVWRHLYPGPPPPVPDVARINPAILVLVNSILGLVSNRGADRHLARPQLVVRRTPCHFVRELLSLTQCQPSPFVLRFKNVGEMVRRVNADRATKETPPPNGT